MQDTDNFPNLKNQFQSLSFNEVISRREQIPEPQRSFLEHVFRTVGNYFADDAFRTTLTPGRKVNIEAQISNIIPQLNTLNQWQIDGTQIVGQNLQNVMSNIQGSQDEIDLRFGGPYQLYKLQNSDESIDQVISDAKSYREKIKNTYEEMVSTLDAGKQLTGDAGSNKLADYFQTLANGMNVQANDSHRNAERKKLHVPSMWPTIAIGAILLFIVIERLSGLGIDYSKYSRVLIVASVSLALPIMGILLLKTYNFLNDNYPGGYQRAAVLWAIGAVLSTLATAVYAAILVIQLGPEAGWEEIIPKVIGLLAPAYFVRFCVQNYKANMHLSIQNTHRATVSRVVRSFSDLVSHQNPSFEQEVLKSRNEIIQAATEVIFIQSESGYLTTKEGAGTGDNMLDSLNRQSK